MSGKPGGKKHSSALHVDGRGGSLWRDIPDHAASILVIRPSPTAERPRVAARPPLGRGMWETHFSLVDPIRRLVRIESQPGVAFSIILSGRMMYIRNSRFSIISQYASPVPG